ncbi:MAG: light-harvesting antenna LH1, alpha subunit [Pseudomonadota bacterium]
MYRVWQVFDVRVALIGLYSFLGFLTIMIHLILLSTDRYNWLEQKYYDGAPATTQSEVIKTPRFLG